MNEKIKPKLIGGLGEINYGKQYRMDDRVYNSKEIAMVICTQPVGNTGGNSYLYLVEENERTNNM